MAKIIPLFAKKPALTPLMLKALRKAYEMESQNEPFGQIDIFGSFAALLKRELIDAKTIVVKGERLVSWYVTRAGKYALTKEGFSDHQSEISN